MLLAVDTSTRMIGVALYDGSQVLSEMIWQSKNHHTIELAPAVAQSLARVGAAPADLQALGVALGPGSFTGLRIGLALAKGLALGRRLPLVGIPTLDVLAAAQPISRLPLVAVIEAGRKRLAFGWYQAKRGRWQAASGPENLAPDAFVESIQKPAHICGELSKTLREKLASIPGVVLASPAQSARRPAVLAELAWERWQNGQADDPATLKPIYLHHGEPIPE